MNLPITYFGDLVQYWQPRKDSLRRAILDRTPPFWRFQILGFTGWTIWALPLHFYHYTSIAIGLWMGLAREIIGFLPTIGLSKRLVAVRGTRTVTKRDLLWNDVPPKIEVDPETYTVNTDGRELRCAPPPASSSPNATSSFKTFFSPCFPWPLV